MATGPPHPCAEPGCNVLVPAGVDRCSHHVKVQNMRRRAMEPARQTDPDAPRYDTRWAKARRGFLAKHPVCVRCGAPATVVDHITPHRGDWRLFWERANWQSVGAP